MTGSGEPGLPPPRKRSAWRAGQGFWTVAVGVPAVFSVMRLWIEAGGELQTTLLLVANVGPVNLLAALFTTATRLVTTGLVTVFALGSVLAVSTEGWPRRRPLFARWYAIAPPWFLAGLFAIALATWQIIFLPLLVVAAVAVFQRELAALGWPRWRWAVTVAVALAGYGWLVAPTVLQAWRTGELFAVALLVVPPVLALGVSGPLPRWLVLPAAALAQPGIAVVMLIAAVPVVMTPVLPMTVTTVATPAGVPEEVRGHVISTDDVNTVILQERGGVRYIDNDDIEARVLCPTAEELVRYRFWVREFHVEDSLLGALGRRVRPTTPVSAVCRIPT
ncbi:hypothetical protein [Catellatospora coxensis]|uniref:Uncharacterized protein n=1 Tax=Catellatospora coxensis TaxID=310354 RepID=A0A8J3L743_9ACTN|nr:hypothetical protein [Catellatospora coxensis]GIG09130.1 hypothetical protein Cco03nite_58300 [Catellatospora coxensis]